MHSHVIHVLLSIYFICLHCWYGYMIDEDVKFTEIIHKLKCERISKLGFKISWFLVDHGYWINGHATPNLNTSSPTAYLIL